MAFKVSKLQMLRGSLARRVLMFAFLAVAMISLLWIISDDDDAVEIFPESTDHDCDVGTANSGQRFFPGRFLKPVTFYPFPLAEPPSSSSSSSCTDLTAASIIFRELRDRKILNSGARALCVGGAKASSDASVLQELGFKDALAVGPHLFSSLARKGLAYKIIAFEDDSFDFAFSRTRSSSDHDRAAVPALLVLEMERVLKPGGFGVVLIPSMSGFSTMKLAAPISSLLKRSSIAHAYEVDAAFTLVAFKKKQAAAAVNGVDTEHTNHELYHHTGNCRSVVNNKDFMGSLEPLDREKSMGALRGFSYLPDFVDISARKRLMFIEIGEGHPYANSSIANWFLPLYPAAKSRAFDIYAVDGDVSLGTSYAGRPGITFVHSPGLSEQIHDHPLPAPADDQASDILDWFNKTAARGDFLVLKMNNIAGGRTGLALLRKLLLKDGGLCLVDELFLHCPKSSRDTLFEDCLHFLQVLRNSGLFAHLW